MKKLLKSRELALGILALVLIVIISVNNQRFLSAVNLMNVLKSNIILAIVCLLYTSERNHRHSG